MADIVDNFGYDGKVAHITGAGNGLGREHALLLAGRGAQVVVNDLGGSVAGDGADSGPAQQVADEIEAAGGVAVASTASVSTRAGGEDIVRTAVDAFGRVDIVINNAGILRDKAFHNLTDDLLDPVLDVHLRGAFYVTQPAWKLMRDQGYGRVVNTSSAAGIFGNFGQTNYGAAKMGLVGFTRVLAQEGAKYGIKANVIAPGAKTRMTEDLMGAMSDKLDPRLVSPLVAFLAHEDCPVSGQAFSVGGGRVAQIFIGVTQGIFDAELSVETVRDRWEELCDQTGYVVPTSATDELGLLFPHLS
ncbi:MAG: SDR family oxidoreductase [Acidimicrobiales bacterium]|nr:SDR family oxidoreductase [Acidimicrobiales bacterium]